MANGGPIRKVVSDVRAMPLLNRGATWLRHVEGIKNLFVGAPILEESFKKSLSNRTLILDDGSVLVTRRGQMDFVSATVAPAAPPQEAGKSQEDVFYVAMEAFKSPGRSRDFVGWFISKANDLVNWEFVPQIISPWVSPFIPYRSVGTDTQFALSKPLVFGFEQMIPDCWFDGAATSSPVVTQRFLAAGISDTEDPANGLGTDSVNPFFYNTKVGVGPAVLYPTVYGTLSGKTTIERTSTTSVVCNKFSATNKISDLVLIYDYTVQFPSNYLNHANCDVFVSGAYSGVSVTKIFGSRGHFDADRFGFFGLEAQYDGVTLKAEISAATCNATYRDPVTYYPLLGVFNAEVYSIPPDGVGYNTRADYFINNVTKWSPAGLPWVAAEDWKHLNIPYTEAAPSLPNSLFAVVDGERVPIATITDIKKSYLTNNFYYTKGQKKGLLFGCIIQNSFQSAPGFDRIILHVGFVAKSGVKVYKEFDTSYDPAHELMYGMFRIIPVNTSDPGADIPMWTPGNAMLLRKKNARKVVVA